MTPQQITLVQTSWSRVVPIAATAADLFYDRLFTLDPSLRALFPSDITEQKKKLMQMIGVVVNGLHKLDTIVSAVQDLGRRHVRYGVKDAHYDTVGEALLWTLEQGLGADWTAETADAWVAAYTILATTMKDAAAAEAD